MKPEHLLALSRAAQNRLSAANSRTPFVKYAKQVLDAICGTCRLQRGGRDLEVQSFRLRSSPKVRFAERNICPSTEVDPVKATVEALLSISVPENQSGPLYQGRWLLTLDGQKFNGKWDSPASHGDDFVFRYPCAKSHHQPASVATFCASTVAVLLDAIDLYSDGERVCPEALIFGSSTVEVLLPAPLDAPALGYRTDGRSGTGERQPLHSIAATEPAIATLAHHWGLLASALRDHRAFPVHLEGFRLRSTSDWIVPSSGDPADVYEYLGRVCNVACKFCYLYGNPGDLAIGRGSHVVSKSEIETRLKYFDPNAGQALFQADWESNETLIDPKLTYILKALREKTQNPLFFVTNGSPLTPRLVTALAEAQPVHVIVSLNTADPTLRAAIMGERKRLTHQALDSLRLLCENRISFGVSVAAFPDFPLEDLSLTIARVKEYFPAFVRVNLPGFSKHLLPEKPFDTPTVWRSIVEWARAERKKTDIPIITIPSAFEENFWNEDANAPRIVGVVPGSPAANAGVISGDLIFGVNGNSTNLRSAAQSLLTLTSGSISIEISRAGLDRKIILNASESGYPYVGESYGKYRFPWGVILAPSLGYADAVQIRNALDTLPSNGVAWMFTSKLMLPAAQQLMALYLPEFDKRLRFILPSNEYLGGNIMVLDMCSVGDLALCLSNEIKNRGSKPQLLLVASSGFNIHGRDITGKHFGDLERHFGISIALIDCTRFVF